MRRYLVTMKVSTIVRAEDEEHAIGHALENVHDSTVDHVIDVEEYDPRLPSEAFHVRQTS